MLGGLFSMAGSAIQGHMSQKSAREQMDFQAMMSNTAYRRATTDLRAAGLNPILAAGGRGASTPPGAGYQYPNMGEAFLKGATERAVREKMQEDARLSTAHANTAKAQKRKLEVETDLLRAGVPTAAMRERVMGEVWGTVSTVLEGVRRGDFAGGLRDAGVPEAILDQVFPKPRVAEKPKRKKEPPSGSSGDKPFYKRGTRELMRKRSREFEESIEADKKRLQKRIEKQRRKGK